MSTIQVKGELRCNLARDSSNHEVVFGICGKGNTSVSVFYYKGPQVKAITAEHGKCQLAFASCYPARTNG